MRPILLALSLLLLPAAAQAASFDCAKARSRVEIMICKDPDLSKLDEEIASAYREALKAWGGAIAAYVREDQKGWIAARAIMPPGVDGSGDGGGCPDDAELKTCMRDIHRHRLAVLLTPGYRLSGVYERGKDFLRIIPWPEGLDLAFSTGTYSAYMDEAKRQPVAPGADRVEFTLLTDTPCRLAVSFSAAAAEVKQTGPCDAEMLNGRWIRNPARQAANELY